MLTLTQWLSDSVTLITSGASCDAKKHCSVSLECSGKIFTAFYTYLTLTRYEPTNEEILARVKPLAVLQQTQTQVTTIHIGIAPVCDEKPISILETGTRISFFQSHVRDGNENFFPSISCFKTRTRISFFNLGHRDENKNQDWDNSRKNFREFHLLLVYWLIFSKKGC